MRCPHCGKAIPSRNETLTEKLKALSDGTPRSIAELMTLTDESVGMVQKLRKQMAAEGFNLPLPLPELVRATAARNKAIYEDRLRGGITYRALGARYGITTSRVRDIFQHEDRRARGWPNNEDRARCGLGEAEGGD